MWLPGLAAVDNSFQTAGTTVTAHATPHTKGSWVQLVASAPFDVTLLGVGVAGQTGSSSTNTSQLTDIGIGATEVVLIDNIPTGYNSLTFDFGGAGPAWFPVEIPSGTKISARMQALITVDTADIQLFMFGKSSWSSVPMFQSVDTIGALTASSHGTNISGGGIVEIIASTAEDYKALGIGVDGGGSTSMGTDTLIELFVGAGAAEKTLIDNLQYFTGATETMEKTVPPQGIIPMEMNIPSGTRLSAQTTASTTIGLVLYGFR